MLHVSPPEYKPEPEPEQIWGVSSSVSIHTYCHICVASLQKGPHVAIYQSRENRS